MWCKSCRQDVPALPSGDEQSLCCPRCGEDLCVDATKASAAAPAVDNQPPAYDDWEMGEELRHIGRVLHTDKVNGNEAKTIYRREASRFDMPHASPTAWHVPTADPSSKPRKAEDAQCSALFSACTWLSLSLGTVGFVCGGILLGWALATGRQELWTIGLPVALVGQIALMVGLVLQLDRLWHDNRAASAKLDNVDEQLHELKATTTLLGTTHSPAASAFYSHFAGGAGSQLLLTDLKSQLDLLALKIAQDGR